MENVPLALQFLEQVCEYKESQRIWSINSMALSLVPVKSPFFSAENVHFSHIPFSWSSFSTSQCQKLFATALADSSPGKTPEMQYNGMVKCNGIYYYTCYW